MARKRAKSLPPFLRRGGRATRRQDPTQPWFRRYPALKAAFAEAQSRFAKMDGVCGVGIGRKFSESTTSYSNSRPSHGGFCIKVFVEQKKDDVPRREYIPKYVIVAVPGSRNKQRVDVDVVCAGDPGPRRAPARQSVGRGWPHHGKINPGHMFAFGKKPAAQTPAQFRPNDVELGTTGALLRFQDGSHWGISAGHVFTNPCAVRFDRPVGARALGAEGKSWRRVDGAKFYPPTIRGTRWIRDQMLFPIPHAYLPDDGYMSWPDGFDRQLATQADIERAVLADGPSGFIWVDRRGSRPGAIPVDLEAAIPFFTAKVKCGNTTRQFSYGTTWPLRFLRDEGTTLGGDSGAPVFLWTENNATCRLLGMHFLEWKNHSYAMDARSFLREVLLSKMGEDVFFA